MIRTARTLRNLTAASEDVLTQRTIIHTIVKETKASTVGKAHLLIRVVLLRHLG